MSERLHPVYQTKGKKKGKEKENGLSTTATPFSNPNSTKLKIIVTLNHIYKLNC